MPHVVKMPDAPRGDVFVLGAGFSRAVYRRMPLTDDLGRLVLERLTDRDLGLGRPEFSPDGLTFETWLSWLGEEQPFDDEEATLTRRALFVRLQELIADALDRAEQEAMDEPPARWLYSLVQLFQLGVSTVITFNYDRVVESNLPDRLTDRAGEFVRPEDVVVPLFTENAVMMSGSRPVLRDVAAFDYLKLHGSVDWWVYPGDQTGASLEQGRRTSQLTRAQRNLRSTRRRFIVPPTSQKSGYYRSELTHYLWQQAATALRNAERIAILGYSLPLTDNATASMLADTIARTRARIDVVNPSAGRVGQNLAAVGCALDRLHLWENDACIAAYVDDRVDELAQRFARRLGSLVRSSDRLAFAWNGLQRGVVEQARCIDHGRTLLLETSEVSDRPPTRPDVALPDAATAPRALTGDGLPIGFDQVDKVVLANREHGWPVVATVSRATVDGPDDDDWVTFYPIGRPPESSFAVLRY